MTRLLTICLAFWVRDTVPSNSSLTFENLSCVNDPDPVTSVRMIDVQTIFDIGQSVSTKLEFDEEKESSGQVSESSKEDEDVEVKHTIVLSTKLKNNRRGLHNDGDSTAQTYSIGHALKAKTDESDEVPVINGYKAIESTLIRMPDSRVKPPVFTNPVYISRSPYDYNRYPVAGNPLQWKPSSFFNNVNWWSDENGGSFNDFSRRNRPSNENRVKFHRKITDDGVREFYCRKCREMSNGPEDKGCVQQRSIPWSYESTTQKIKIDGKLAKLN